MHSGSNGENNTKHDSLSQPQGDVGNVMYPASFQDALRFCLKTNRLNSHVNCGDQTVPFDKGSHTFLMPDGDRGEHLHPLHSGSTSLPKTSESISSHLSKLKYLEQSKDYSNPYFGTNPVYNPQPVAYPQCHGVHQERIVLPLEMTEDPVYVNAKQYHGILRRRKLRAKAELENKALKVRKPYLHESRHLHAMRRARGCGGRFLNTKNLDKKSSNSKSETYPTGSTNAEASSNGGTTKEASVKPTYIDVMQVFDDSTPCHHKTLKFNYASF